MRALTALLDVLLPPQCLVCRRVEAPPLCACCLEAIPRIVPPICVVCGRPRPDPSAVGGSCFACRVHPPGFRSARAVAVYAGAARDAIHALKFHGRPRLADPLGRLMAEVATGEAACRGCDLIVPVPLPPQRLRRRGFNQAELLARPVADALSLPLRPDLLTRMGDPRPQHRLRLPERRLNVGGGFVARSLHRPLAVLLVDDVMTTGATVAACARALRQAGAAGVSVLVFALTLRDDP